MKSRTRQVTSTYKLLAFVLFSPEAGDGYSVLQMVTVYYRWLQSTTDGYRELQMVTVYYRWLQCTTDGYSVLQ